MKRTLFIILAVIAVFLLIGIAFTGMASRRSATSNSGRDLSYGMGGGAPEVGIAPSYEMPAATVAPAAPPFSAQDAHNSAAQPAPRLVIQNADLAIVVKDPKAKMKEVSDLAREFGGFVVSSNLYQSSTSLGKQVPEANIVIRVPSERLDEALTRIKKDAVDIQYENRSGQDVTDQYVDLQARLKAKQAAEQKLLEIMDQALKAEDVLNIYMQVQNVQTEIEQLKGQIKYLEDSAALSAISVRLIAEEGTQPIAVGPWKPEGAAKAAIQDLVIFFQNFVEFLIRFVLYTLPALVLIAIPLLILYLVVRAVYRRVRKPKVVVEEVRSDEMKK
jgi:hypothetical protein